MIWLRSLVFNSFYFGWTAVLAILFLPLLAGRRDWAQAAARIWVGGLIHAARVICGLHWRVEGTANIPRGPAVVAARHQSAWDTFFFHSVLADPVYVMKQELLDVPLVGWYMRKVGSIAIDRRAGLRALRILVEQADKALAAGRQVIVFPEGTRTPPGARPPLHAGIAALYTRLDVPVIPVALNSGLFWKRRAFLKRPGTITVRFLPPAPRGLDRPAFMSFLTRSIQEGSDALPGSGAVPAARRDGCESR